VFDWLASFFAQMSVGQIITLISALIAAFTSLINLYYSFKLNDKLAVNKIKRDILLSQLKHYYNPIYILLSINNEIYLRAGPQSPVRSDTSIPEEETANVWKALVLDVILPNNERIAKIIENNLHLLSPQDDIKPYIDFLVHHHAYTVFKRNPYEAYKYFKYPNGLLEHVDSIRQQLLRLQNSAIEQYDNVEG